MCPCTAWTVGLGGAGGSFTQVLGVSGGSQELISHSVQGGEGAEPALLVMDISRING